MSGIEVVNWNPYRWLLSRRLRRYTRIPMRVNNFGDLLGPMMVRKLVPPTFRARQEGGRLLCIGSIIHRSCDGDTVWGSGVNGNVSLDRIRVCRLDVRAVRGPLTAEVLTTRGLEVPEVYGDPGLLAPSLFGIERAQVSTKKLVIVPHFEDIGTWRRREDCINPRSSPIAVIRAISAAEFVVSSSLHGLIIAESLGIPAAMLLPRSEALFKYQDYLEGTGRSLGPIAETLSQAVDNPLPPPVWSPSALMDSFPADLWMQAD